MLFSQIWSLLLLGAFLLLPRLLRQSKISNRQTAGLIVFSIALVARLLPALTLPTGAMYDIESYSIVGNLVLKGQDVYSAAEAENRHPYLPLQMYWSALSRALAGQDQDLFTRVVKLEPILADAAIALLLFVSLLRAASLETAFLGGLLYATNPIPIYVSAYHGQFDAVAALMVLLAFYSLMDAPGLSGIWLGFGILLKSWPVLSLPSLLSGIKSWKSQLGFTALAILIPLGGVLLYTNLFPANFQAVVTRAISYNRGVGAWGYPYFFRLLAFLQPALTGIYTGLANIGRFLTLTGLALAWWYRARKEAPQDGFLTVLVVFFAITHAFSIQYLMWLAPFAVLSMDFKWLKWYTIAAFLYMFVAYNTLLLQTNITSLLPWPQADLFIIVPASLPVWFVCIAWAYQRVFHPGLNTTLDPVTGS